MRAPSLFVVLCCLLSLLVTACINDLACVEGRQVECACPGGADGVQVCSSDGRFESCECDGQPDFSRPVADAGDAAIDAARRIDASLPVDAFIPPLVEDAASVVKGEGTFLALYAEAGFIWVVDSAGVSRLSLADGSQLARWSAPRPLTAAAFDGTHLVALDGAKLTSLLAADLTVVVEGPLTEACASAVLLSENRLVCGPANDWDRIFYTYDVTTAKLLASSGKYTYNGIPMRRVPGLDAFVAVSTDSSPSDYHLYKLGSDNAVVYLNESPYHGDFPISGVYAFDGAPPTHLITAGGLLLSFSLDCAAGNTCFVKDGALGTFTGAQSFTAMDGNGSVLTGIVDPRGGSYSPFDTTPTQNVLLQTIDLPSRTILSQQNLALGGRVLGLRGLIDQKKVVLAVGKVAVSSFDPPVAGYEILSVDLP